MTEFAISETPDEGARVADADLAVRLYLSFRREVHWVPSLFSNAYCAYEEPDSRFFFLSALHEQTTRTARVHVLDTLGDVELEDTERVYSMSAKDVAASIMYAARQARRIKKNSMEKGFLAPPGRYFDVVVLHVSSDDLVELLEDSDTAGALSFLLDEGAQWRVPVVVMTDRAVPEHVAVLREINWAAFMGDGNVEFAEKLYSKLKTGIFNPGRVKLGVLAAYDRTYLSVLQPLKYEPSEYSQVKKVKARAEKRVYDDFLKELRDGND